MEAEMNLTVTDLRAKASAIVSSLSQMSPEQRGERPNADFCDDYNRLRAMAVDTV